MTNSLGGRIKTYYEDRTKSFLTRKVITCIRLDGKGFSKFTKNLNKPFDDGFSDDMDETAAYLCQNIQGVKFAYTQSDEISIILSDCDTIESEAWFDYNVQKMVSIAASLATAKFNQLRLLRETFKDANNGNFELLAASDLKNQKLAAFDARVFQLPNIDEMFNTILWRQQDCTRNSISMAASANYSHKELMGKSSNEKQEMLFQKGINWNDYKTKYKRGVIIKRVPFEVKGPNGEIAIRNKWVPVETPILTENREFIYELMATK